MIKNAFMQALQAPEHKRALALAGSILDEWRKECEEEFLEEGERRGTWASLLALGTKFLGEPDPGTIAELKGVKNVNELLRLLVEVPTATSWEALLAAPQGGPTNGAGESPAP